MNKVTNFLLKSILIIFSFILLWIIMMSIFDFDPIVYEFNPIILVIGIIIYFIILKLLYDKIIPKIMNFKYLPLIMIGIYIILCLAAGYLLSVYPSWDLSAVMGIATNCAKHTSACEFSYLYYFSNNTMIVAFYIAIFSIFAKFGVIHFTAIATITNTLIVALSGVILYLISKEVFNKQKQIMLLFILLFTTPLYLYCPIYYTDTISLLMYLLIIYFFLLSNKHTDTKKKILFSILCGISITLGFKFKLTTIFIVIAYLVYEILNRKLISDFKKSKIMFITIIASSFIVYIGLQFTFNKLIFNDKELYEKYKVPYEHWVVMGLIEKGGYDFDSWLAIKDIEGYENKQVYARGRINQLLDEYNANSFIKHLNKKLKYAWTDGTYYAPAKVRLQISHYNLAHDFVLADGKYNRYYKYIPQVMHIAMLILILISSIDTIIKNKYDDKKVILYITMFGFMIFLLIWENRSRYIFNIVPLMLLLEVGSIELLLKIKKIKY